MGADESKPSGSNGSTIVGGSSYLLDAILEHGGPINCMTLSDDQSILATGSDDRSVRLWTTKTPRCNCIGILSGHEGPVTYLLIEEIFCISCSIDRTIRKWDMATCVCMTVFEGHADRVNRLVSTGDFVISSSSDRTVRCWDLDDGTCIRTFAGHAAGVFPLLYLARDDPDCGGDLTGSTDVAYRPPATPKIRDVIVTGSTDCTARTWSFETGCTVTEFRGHSGPITCLGTDADNRILLTASTDGSVRSWSLDEGQPLKIFEGHRMPIMCMTIFDGIIYTGSADNTARAFTIEGRSTPAVFRCHEKSITCIKVVDNLVFTGGGDSIATCFDKQTAEIKRVFRCPNGTQVNAFQVVDGRMFLAASDNVLRIYTLRGLRPFKPSLRPLTTAVAIAGTVGRQSPQLQEPSTDSGLSTAPPSRHSTASNTDSPRTARSPMTTAH